jgi:hypothetical protein
MSWTHVVAFGLGALWMLTVFITAGVMRSPESRGESEFELPNSWTEAHAGQRYWD